METNHLRSGWQSYPWRIEPLTVSAYPLHRYTIHTEPKSPSAPIPVGQ